MEKTSEIRIKISTNSRIKLINRVCVSNNLVFLQNNTTEFRLLRRTSGKILIINNTEYSESKFLTFDFLNIHST